MATEKSKVMNTAMIQTALNALNVNPLTSKEKETLVRNAVMGSKKTLRFAMTLMKTEMMDAHDIARLSRTGSVLKIQTEKRQFVRKPNAEISSKNLKRNATID